MQEPNPRPSRERRATPGGHVAVTLVALGALLTAAWLGSVVYKLRQEHRDAMARRAGQLEAAPSASAAAALSPTAPGASASAAPLR